MTLRSMGKSDSALKRGMTLVELLIVISITVLIAAVVLPTVKTLLKDRKGNQAALQLRAFIQAAQARAIGRNREVAVVLERNTKYGDNYINRNAVIRLSLAEVLPPYRGDLENSTVALSACPTAPYNTGNINQATINLGLNATARHFVNIGDRIAFDDHPERFEIVDFSPKDASGKVPVGTPLVNVIFWNQPYNYAYAGTSRQSTSPRGPIVNLIPGDHKFRIYSRPRRLFSKPLDMPKGLASTSQSAVWDKRDTASHRTRSTLPVHSRLSISNRFTCFSIRAALCPLSMATPPLLPTWNATFPPVRFISWWAKSNRSLRSVPTQTLQVPSLRTTLIHRTFPTSVPTGSRSRRTAGRSHCLPIWIQVRCPIRAPFLRCCFTVVACRPSVPRQLLDRGEVLK